ncbi:putative quinol monooxygenase [Aeromonas dhakensis]|uniref:putative quinol monooxygenase n=1 Tax=Aeromonas dhakensis TaxID=196024 RepID=UPI000F88B1C4|nr:putative quinol monooxygenase [Aeromonas dhakensis]EIM1707837.1 antibiotic biosynthesis monooxygenase [Aeromonas dhakensis]RUQ12814.1 antibiotic biosynthesis monooxygenase [Aeromonas dhakensis]WAF71132.1 antibiotic biosynthesis monooxygenase [Aeromonas dhakensis]
MYSPVIVIAQLEAIPEFAPQFRAALEPLIAATLQEAGCLRYQLHQDLDNPHCWMLYEVWESDAALSAHQGQPHFTEFVATAEPWFAGSTIRRYQPVDA